MLMDALLSSCSAEHGLGEGLSGLLDTDHNSWVKGQ